jgi:hypothetical protein
MIISLPQLTELSEALSNNISAISWQPVLVVEEAGVPGENLLSWKSH